MPGATAAMASIPSASRQPAAFAVAVLMLALGGASAYFAMRGSTDVPRAVPGSPGSGSAQAPAAGDLPQGHPSIELPKEVVAFLDELAAEADRNPQSVEAAQKLARARYRATVINESYRTAAEQALARLLALDPANQEGLRISANLAYDRGDYPEAEKRFRTYLEKNPDDSSARTDLGSTQLFQDRLEDAVKNYAAAIAQDPKFMQAHFNMGIALQKQGRKDEAIASLRRALDLAEDPDQRQHVENALADLEGREPQPIAGSRMAGAAPQPPAATAGNAPGAPSGGMPMPPPAPDRDVPTNASGAFQRAAEKPLVTHPIVGPRVVGFDWTGPAALRVKLADFPMDRMPPFARAKFKSAMSDKLGAIASANGVSGSVTVELVDDATGSVMDKLDSVADAAPGAAK